MTGWGVGTFGFFQSIRRPVVPAMYENGVTVPHGGGNHSPLQKEEQQSNFVFGWRGGPIVTADKLVPSSRSSISYPPSPPILFPAP